MPDKRGSHRVRKNLFTAVKWYDAEGEIDGGDIGETLDISTSGMLIRTENPLPFKARLTIALAVEDDVLKLEGEVARLEREDDRRTLMGLRFLGLDDKIKNALARALGEE